MYNGIGLQTAKGSGTNGYVQRNVASIRSQRLDWKDANKNLKHGEVIKVKKANPELLLHDQKRKVELDLLKLEEELRTAGMGEDEIEKNIEREREQMMRAVNEGSLRYASDLDKKDTHALALEKEKQMKKFESAFSIDTSAHVSGKAFDQELQAQEKVERMQQRAELEQQRLKAACAAEKAQKKAEKLRAKAEKAKKESRGQTAEVEGKTSEEATEATGEREEQN